MTRSEIQAFIDGFLKAGGDPKSLKTEVPDWLENHPLYPKTQKEREIIVSDLESYRGV